MARFTGLLVLLLSACASAFVPASPSWARGSVAVNAGPKEALDRFGASFKGIGGGNAPYTKPLRAPNEGKGNVRKVGGAGYTYGDVKSLDAAFCFVPLRAAKGGKGPRKEFWEVIEERRAAKGGK
jgi:hypothetical protein